MRQIPLAIGPGHEPTFDGFVVGANDAVVAHLRAAADGGVDGTPLYLWGPPGSGKTHLLRALAAALNDAGHLVGWFDPDAPAPWTLDPAWTLVVVDRCDALDAPAQRAAFQLFEGAVASGVRFAAAGRAPPVDLPLRDDLRTRLGWGHVFAVGPLAEEEVRATLRREADRRGIFLSDEVMRHLLTRFPRDLGSLMRVLDRLDEFALSRSRQVTVPLLRQMLAEEGPLESR